MACTLPLTKLTLWDPQPAMVDAPSLNATVPPLTVLGVTVAVRVVWLEGVNVKEGLVPD